MNEFQAVEWLDAHLDPPERLSQRETALWLADKAHSLGVNGRCVEVGVWCGYTALAMALCGPTVFAVDPFIASDSQTGQQALNRIKGGLSTTWWNFVRHVHEAQDPVKVIPCIGRSADIAMAFGLDSVDLVFIDGDHGLFSVITDLVSWVGLLKSGGILCGHDFAQPQVGNAVRAFLSISGWPEVSTGPDQIWWVRKP